MEQLAGASWEGAEGAQGEGKSVWGGLGVVGIRQQRVGADDWCQRMGVMMRAADLAVGTASYAGLGRQAYIGTPILKLVPVLELRN